MIYKSIWGVLYTKLVGILRSAYILIVTCLLEHKMKTYFMNENDLVKA